MDQQDHGPDKSKAPANDKEPAQARGQADESANDSTWGIGAASALENLRRHGYRARRSRLEESDERPSSE